MFDDYELYNNRETKYSRIIHAEINALLSAGRSTKWATLYTYPFMSCDRCAVQVIQARIGRVVAPKPSEAQSERWGESFSRALSFYREAEIQVHHIDKEI